ncbi:ATP-dependent DNA helicase [Rarobacter faecitabidus]
MPDERQGVVVMSAFDIADALGLPRPTEQQRAVIESPLTPAIVVAGAGSGKTETMAARVVYLIANGIVQADEILGLTFTRKAAAELAHRIDTRLGGLRRHLGQESATLSLADRPAVATYNAYAGALVSEHGLRVGIEPDSALITDAGNWQLASEIVGTWPVDLHTDKAVGTIISAAMSLDSALAEHLCEVSEAREWFASTLHHLQRLPYGPKKRSMNAQAARFIESLRLRSELLDIVAALREAKARAGALSFGDQISRAALLARSAPQVGEGERRRYAAVLLDEYQDTSHAQTTMLAALFGGGHPVMAVGDPHQSIYAWRGASASALGRFRDEFPAADGGRATLLNLTTSWRNDEAVLAAANQVAQPLRDELAGIQVPQLTARPGAQAGAVAWLWADTIEDEAAHIAQYIAERWQGVRRPSAAVLCRTRKYFPAIAAALTAQGIPVEIVGLGGLLMVPEVSDVTALMTVAHDPSRGDALLRLLTGPLFNIAPADVKALTTLARRLDAGIDGERGQGVDRVSLADALDWLVAARKLPSAIEFSEAALTRLRELGRMLRSLRGYLGLALAEVLAHAEMLLGLDIEVPLASGAASGRIHLDALRQVAAGFSASASASTVGAFLSWLAAAEREERGLDRPVSEPDPRAVQLITVHGAKGLEWDLVAVAGLTIGNFPAVGFKNGEPQSSGWLVGEGSLPYPLRGDVRDLARIDLDAPDGAELGQRLDAFRAVVGHDALLEERRLAYVAFTRARSELIVTGARWRDGVKNAAQPSPFLTELVDTGLAARHPESRDLGSGPAANPLGVEAPPGWWPRHAEAEHAEQTPQLALAAAVAGAIGNRPEHGDDEVAASTSPLDVPDGSRVRREGDRPGQPRDRFEDSKGADPVLPIAASNREGELGVGDVTELARILLAERDRHERGERAAIAAPNHLSASAIVRLVQDPTAMSRDWRRPIPRKPSPMATRGTLVHSWIERHYSKAALLDIDDAELYEQDDYVDDTAQLRSVFEASPWAGREPVELEIPVEFTLGSRTIRTRIDAIFADPDNPGGQIVVDWKTGSPPKQARQRAAREIQLAIYRVAWSRISGTPIDDVAAAFFYLATGETVRVERLPGAEELARRLTELVGD